MGDETSVSVPAQRITIRWLVDYVPFGWWWAVGGAVITIASSCYFLGAAFGANLSVREISDRWREKQTVDQEIAALEQQRDRLKAQILVLEVERETAAMTDEEVRDELAAKWTRQ